MAGGRVGLGGGVLVRTAGAVGSGGVGLAGGGVTGGATTRAAVGLGGGTVGVAVARSGVPASADAPFIDSAAAMMPAPSRQERTNPAITSAAAVRSAARAARRARRRRSSHRSSKRSSLSSRALPSYLVWLLAAKRTRQRHDST
ncbi:MAG: hypothetical protein KatS3mg060_1860 [Dehalococcoidia bacterium]|nr:MAG: hypothetical protein KatS3mg060_1860 [Dehalococcoidia bacterium]